MERFSLEPIEFYDEEKKIGKPYGLRRHDAICDKLEKEGWSEAQVVDFSVGIWKGIESERDLWEPEYMKLKTALSGLYVAVKLAPHVDMKTALSFAEEVLKLDSHNGTDK